jgi:hypothetical protein
VFEQVPNFAVLNDGLYLEAFTNHQQVRSPRELESDNMKAYWLAISCGLLAAATPSPTPNPTLPPLTCSACEGFGSQFGSGVRAVPGAIWMDFRVYWGWEPLPAHRNRIFRRRARWPAQNKTAAGTRPMTTNPTLMASGHVVSPMVMMLPAMSTTQAPHAKPTP